MYSLKSMLRLAIWSVLSYVFILEMIVFASGSEPGFMPLYANLTVELPSRWWDVAACGLYFTVLSLCYQSSKIYFELEGKGNVNLVHELLFIFTFPLAVFLTIGVLPAIFCGFLAVSFCATALSGLISFGALTALVIMEYIPGALGYKWWER